MKQLNKKGQILNGLQGAVMAFGSIAVILAIILYVVNQVGAAMPANSNAQNATEEIESKLADAPTWLGIILIVIFATAVLAYFYMK